MIYFKINNTDKKIIVIILWVKRKKEIKKKVNKKIERKNVFKREEIKNDKYQKQKRFYI